jgi:hypothetical protein
MVHLNESIDHLLSNGDIDGGEQIDEAALEEMRRLVQITARTQRVNRGQLEASLVGALRAVVRGLPEHLGYTFADGSPKTRRLLEKYEGLIDNMAKELAKELPEMDEDTFQELS